MTGIDSKQAAGVGSVSVLTALSGLVILVLAARGLSAAENAEFLAFWAALFAVHGILGGVTAETTRAVGQRRLGSRCENGGSTALNSLIVGAALAGLVGAVSVPLGMEGMELQRSIAAILVLTSLVYAVQAALAGSLQAMGRWHSYSALVLMESVFRLLAVAVAAICAGLLGFELACLAALLAGPLVVACSPAARAALLSRADVPLNVLLRRTGQACASAAASAALVVSFPLLVKATTSAADFDAAAPVLLAISLTRAPLMLPLVAFQGVAIATVLRAEEGTGLRALLRPIMAVAGLGVVGTGLAWLIGPRLMLFFGSDYAVAGWVLGALTFSGAGVAILTLTGTAQLAMGRHRVYALGWVAASATAFTLLLLPYSVEVRCVLSLLAGPLVGISVHVYAPKRWA